MAARAMDVRSVSLDPGSDCPASQVTDHHIAAAYDDLDAARELADRSDVVTYEFENVDATAIEVISELKPVYPSPSVLRVCQDREIEKDTLSALGIPVPEYRIVRSVEEAVTAVGRCWLACGDEDGTLGLRRQGPAGGDGGRAMLRTLLIRWGAG